MSGQKNALGFIETVGLAAAVAAADAACKAADVRLIGREISKGYGYVTVKLAGDVGAVKAALAAAKAASEKVNRVWSLDLIPRPAAGLGDVLVWNRETRGAEGWREGQTVSLPEEPPVPSEEPTPPEEESLPEVPETPEPAEEPETPAPEGPEVKEEETEKGTTPGAEAPRAPRRRTKRR